MALALAFGLMLSPAQAQETKTESPLRNEHDAHALDRWVGLAHDRQLLILQSLGVSVPQDFFTCVCVAGGYGQAGTRQYYHPGVIGVPDDRYACQRAGPPCVVQGNGCTRHDLPADRADFETCAASLARQEGQGNMMDNILSALADRANRVVLTGNPVIMNEDPFGRPPADCDKARTEAGLAPLETVPRAVPLDRVIWTLSPDTRLKLSELMRTDRAQIVAVESKLMEAIALAIENSPEIAKAFTESARSSADEIDFRFDAGQFELAFSVDRHNRIHLSEIVVKPGTQDGKPGFEMAVKLALPDEEPEGPTQRPANAPFTLAEAQGVPGGAPRVVGRKVGVVIETPAGELKYGIETEDARDADDLYDGKYQTRAEQGFLDALTQIWDYPDYRIFDVDHGRFGELDDLLAKLDFYVGGAVNIPFSDRLLGGDVDAGFEASWKLKDRYTRWIFSDMHAALDNLLENQKQWEDQRHDYIGREAERFGIDPRCFSVNEQLKLTKAAYARRKETDPSLPPPFRSITEHAAELRAKAAARVSNSAPPKPRPAPPPPPPAFETPKPMRVYQR